MSQLINKQAQTHMEVAKFDQLLTTYISKMNEFASYKEDVESWTRTPILWTSVSQPLGQVSVPGLKKY